MTPSIRSATLTCLMSLAVTPVVSAHSQLGSPLKKRYNLRSISCKACHPSEKKEKVRDVLTAFGTDIAKILEGKKVSERIAATKQQSREERKTALDQIKEEYLKALGKLDKMKAPSGKPYLEALPAGEIEGTKPRS